MEQKQIKLKIIGRVQGVCFRFYAQEEAYRLGLTGWVRNLDDGSVELVAEGAEASLNVLALWCEQGPPSAQVLRVECHWGPATGEFKDFRIARS
jgi:acylphosphatase